MEQFKLKSIDELDIEFINRTKNEPASSSPVKTLIPEMEKPEVNNADETIGAHYFAKPVESSDENVTYAPEGQKKKARPLVPIGQTPSPYSPVGAMPDNQESLDFNEESFEEEEPKK